MAPPSPRLEYERDDKLYTAAMLRFINPVLRAAFGVQVDHGSSGDDYYVAWSAPCALFNLVARGDAEDPRDRPGGPRPSIWSALQPAAEPALLNDAARVARELDTIFWADSAD